MTGDKREKGKKRDKRQKRNLGVEEGGRRIESNNYNNYRGMGKLGMNCNTHSRQIVDSSTQVVER